MPTSSTSAASPSPRSSTRRDATPPAPRSASPRPARSRSSPAAGGGAAPPQGRLLRPAADGRGGGAGAAAVRSAFLALAPVVPTLARRAGLPTTLPWPDAVALTFDDGPHPQGTPAVLEILAAARVP